MSKSIKIFIFTFLVFSFFSNVSLIQAEEGNSNGLNPNSNYDLKVENIGISPLSPAVNQEVIITVQGRNSGTVDLTSGQGLTNIYKNFPGFEQTSMTIPDVSSNNPIEPGDPFMFQFTGSFTTSGDKTLYFKIDNANELLEMNENNNTISRKINVVSSDLNYDLKIENISISSSFEPTVNRTLYQSVITNQAITITVQGRNSGTVDLTSGQGLTNIYRNFPSFEQTSMTIPDVSSNKPIEPGDPFMFRFTGSFTTSGHKTLYFKIDNANELLETNESNNTISKKITVINSANFNSNYDLEPDSISLTNEGLVLSIKNNGKSTFNGDFVISMFDLDGKTYVDYYQFNGSLTPFTTKRLVISNRYGTSQLYPNLEIKVDYANIITETNENNNNIIYNYEEPSVSDWIRVEKGINDSDNFEKGRKPKFEMTSDERFIFNGGQVIHYTPYRGYYYKNIDLDNDFQLVFKTKISTGFTDSNLVYVCLGVTEDGAYTKLRDDGTFKRDDSGFCFMVNSGRSWWTSLYGKGKGGPGFPLISTKLFNTPREDYYDVYDKILGENIYGYKYSVGEVYTVKMLRKDGVISNYIYDSSGQLVYHWKLDDKEHINFKYLSLAIGNSDDDDNYGNYGPKGEIWNIKLTTGDISEEEPIVEEENLIYEALKLLLDKERLNYQDGSEIIGINHVEELKKYSKLVKDNIGTIIIGVQNETIKPVKKVGPIKPAVRFIKKPDSPAVYKLDERKKKIQAIKNVSTFKTLTDVPLNEKPDWSIVEEVSSNEFKAYEKKYKQEVTTVSDANEINEVKQLYQKGIKLIKGDQGSAVYYITKDLEKKAIKDAKLFEELGFDWANIKLLPQEDVDAVVDGGVVEEASDLEDVDGSSID